MASDHNHQHNNNNDNDNNNDFLQKAQLAAESITKGWIRGVFHETSLQVLRQQWKVQKGKDDDDDDDVLELGIEPYMLEKCNNICQKLAIHWENRLMEKDQQKQVAIWIREVAAENDFWSLCNTTTTTNEKEGTRGRRESPVVVHRKDGNNNNKNNNKADGIYNSEEEEIVEEDTGQSSSRSSSSKTDIQLLLPHTKLWHLLLHNESNDLKVLNKQLAWMGRKGDTEWPGDWQPIENICNKLKLRLHSKPPRVRFEIIPKEMAAPEERKEEELDVVPSARLRALLDKKKKRSSSSSDQEAPTTTIISSANNNNKRARLQQELLMENARPPSKQPAQEKWHWESMKDSISNEEKDWLEHKYIHDLDESDPSNTILGALLPLGSTHFTLSGGEEHIANLGSERKKRLTTRKITNERLDGKKIVRNERKRPVSKVIRAQLEDEEQYLELDLGECMVELNGKLHAFASLEISLLDRSAEDERRILI